MNDTERFRVIMNILEKNELNNSLRNHNFFKSLEDEDLFDENKTNPIIIEIKALEEYLENHSNSNTYPEYIMETLRQQAGLDKCDFSRDSELSKLTSDVAFAKVCIWNGLIGWETTIKGWIRDIYKIDIP